MSDPRTQTCSCGSDTYHVRWRVELDPSPWVECAECGRPTGTVGDPQEKFSTCTECGNRINGDKMIPMNGDGAMHPDCWLEAQGDAHVE